jgi:hypothetical protein
MKGVMIDGSFTAGSEKGSQETEKQEEVVRAVIRNYSGIRSVAVDALGHR